MVLIIRSGRIMMRCLLSVRAVVTLAVVVLKIAVALNLLPLGLSLEHCGLHVEQLCEGHDKSAVD